MKTFPSDHDRQSNQQKEGVREKFSSVATRLQEAVQLYLGNSDKKALINVFESICHDVETDPSLDAWSEEGIVWSNMAHTFDQRAVFVDVVMGQMDYIRRSIVVDEDKPPHFEAYIDTAMAVWPLLLVFPPSWDKDTRMQDVWSHLVYGGYTDHATRMVEDVLEKMGCPSVQEKGQPWNAGLEKNIAPHSWLKRALDSCGRGGDFGPHLDLWLSQHIHYLVAWAGNHHDAHELCKELKLSHCMAQLEKETLLTHVSSHEKPSKPRVL